jgi:protein gp37
MKNTAIEWADHTFNPWIGCTKVSPACDHCYAEALMDKRMHKAKWGAGQPRVRTSASNWHQPVKWNAEAAAAGRRARVFCASLADVFDSEVPSEWRRDLLRLIAATQNLDWLLLTKRIGNAGPMLAEAAASYGMTWDGWRNVWIGATVCNEAEADRDIPKLIATPAHRRFLSIEPMLGPINIAWALCSCPWKADAFRTRHLLSCPADQRPYRQWMLDWVIVGGESGPHARPLHPDWVRSVRGQCIQAGVPFFFKQWGEFSLAFDRDRDDPDRRACDRMDRKPGRWINLAGGHGFNGDRVHYAEKVGKKVAGRMLDERTWDEVPA